MTTKALPIPRDSNELLRLTVKRNGVTVTEGVEYQVVRTGTTSNVWVAAEVTDDVTYARVQGLDPGNYRVRARANAGGQTPVVVAGDIQIV